MKIGIISLGLIGGSILKALHNKGFDLHCVTRNLETIEKIKKYTNNVSDNLKILEHCDLIFVCSPINKVIDILEELETIVPKNTIVTDVSSLKEFISKKQYNYSFIPSHPMAGTEKSGFDASFKDLFNNAKWVITPHPETHLNNLNILKNIITEMGATPIITTPQEHDKAVAYISHMPLVLSQALIKMIKNNDLAQTLAASGFKDMTRLSLSNFQMAQDMVDFNLKNIEKAFNDLNHDFLSLIENYNKEELKDIAEIRNNIYK